MDTTWTISKMKVKINKKHNLSHLSSFPISYYNLKAQNRKSIPENQSLKFKAKL